MKRGYADLTLVEEVQKYKNYRLHICIKLEVNIIYILGGNYEIREAKSIRLFI